MKTKVGDYTYAILVVILGLVMIVCPEQVMNFLCYAIAAVLIVLGIVKLISYATKDIKTAIFENELKLGILLIVCGIIFIVKATAIQNLIPVIMGLIIVGNGIGKLQHAINLKRFKSTSSTFVFIISILCIGVGAILIFAASTVTKLITMIIGVGFLVSGLSDIATYIVLSKKIKETEAFSDAMNNVSETVENPVVVEPVNSDNSEN